MTFSVRTVGFEQLGDKMDLLKGIARDEVLVKAFTAGAQPIANAARGNARRRSGKLANSIDVGTELSPRQSTLNGPHAGVQVFVGPGPLPQAITEEFGTLHEEPHPFMRPAWDAEQNAAISEVARVMTDEVDKVAQG